MLAKKSNFSLTSINLKIFLMQKNYRKDMEQAHNNNSKEQQQDY